MKLPRRDGLNIVPFIDIMLVLLCIVLSVSTFIAQGLIKVDLPSSKNAVKSDEIKEISIKVDKESKIYIDEKLVDDENLTMHFVDLDPKDLVLL
ncbi:MAG: biopolymer transporter ExbD, partial [Campylobacter sp.]|nr:biopolymer transporter ExbD [Campylobacter sp.]